MKYVGNAHQVAEKIVEVFKNSICPRLSRRCSCIAMTV
jgi:hypothetical protein